MKINKIERLKSSLSPYDFRSKITSLDLANLSEEDRFYLKNYGIYNIKLRPENFILRLRIPAGRIMVGALEDIGKIADTHRCQLLLTARAQIELHGLHVHNVLEVWQKVQDTGLTTLQTFTDNFRNIVTDPFDGVAESNMLEVYPLIQKMQAVFLDKPTWMGMIPRKFNAAISATKSNSFHFFGNDLCFVLAQKEDLIGFNLYLGGKNSEVAKDSGIFVLPHETIAMFEAVAKAYMMYGLRGSRSKTRLFHLIDAIGMESFREKIAEFYPHELVLGGIAISEKAPFHSFTKLKDGSYGYCYRSKFGKIDTKVLLELTAFAKQHSLDVRIGIDQNIYLLGLYEKWVPFEEIKGASHITACAGSRYCALSLWDIKAETSYLPLAKLEKYDIGVGFSGCLKGCGRHHHEDIGLVGLRTNLFGPTIKAARLFLGSEYDQSQAPSRLIFHVVPLEKLSSLIEVIIEEFVQSGEKDFESFSKNHLNRFSSGFLMLWFLSKLYLHEKISFDEKEEKELYKMLSQYPDFPKVQEKSGDYAEAVRMMMHLLWDVK